MADNQFTPIPLGPYNQNPPPDDGSQSEENRITWKKIKEKLTDATATIWDSLNTNISSAFAKTINTDPDQDNLVQGSVAYSASALTVANGQITPSRRNHSLINEGAAATDDLAQMLITSISDGGEIIVRMDTTGQTLTFKHMAGGSGQMWLSGEADFELSGIEKSLQFQRRGSTWYQIAGPGTPPIFSEAYESAEQSITTSGLLTLAHGLSSQPKLVIAVLKCNSVEHNYSAGDEVVISSQQVLQSGGSPAGRGVSIVPDATNIQVRYGNATNVFDIINATTGAGTLITNANWRLIVRAWA